MKPSDLPSPKWWQHVAWAWAGLILLLTLSPAPEIAGSVEDLPSTYCLVCGSRGVADGILNSLLFLPLAFALTTATNRPLGVLVLVVMMSTGIELLQGVIPGRYVALGDVVYNTMGGVAGIGLATVRRQLLWPSRQVARALVGCTGAATAALLFVPGVLLVPSFPPTTYYGQWTADLPYMEAYQGQVLEAWIGSMYLGSEITPNPKLAVDLLRSGAPLHAQAIAGPAPAALAPIVSILDGSGVEIMVLGADATDLVLRVRYRANDFRLDRPDLRIPRALATTLPGDTIRLRAEMTVEGYALQMDENEYAPLRHTPGDGWALLLHLEHTPPWADFALGLTWVAWPLVLAGWWAPTLGWAAGALSLSVSGMAMGAAAGPLTTMTVAEVCAALGGVVLGAGLRRRFGRSDEDETEGSSLGARTLAQPEELGCDNAAL